MLAGEATHLGWLAWIAATGWSVQSGDFYAAGHKLRHGMVSHLCVLGRRLPLFRGTAIRRMNSNQ